MSYCPDAIQPDYVAYMTYLERYAQTDDPDEMEEEYDHLHPWAVYDPD